MALNISRTFSIVALMMAGLCTQAYAGPFSALIVYGDSLSDNGNLFAAAGQPGPPYSQGRRSNGPVAVEQLAAKLNIPLLDFAWLGATTGIGNIADGGTATSTGAFGLPGMQTEFALSQIPISPYLASALFVVWGGPNDFLSPSPLDASPLVTASRAVTNLLGIVASLQGLGAKNILVPGMADLGLTPFFQAQGLAAAAQASALTSYFNGLLKAGLPPGVVFFDTSLLEHNIVSNPGAFGFTNVTNPCFNGVTVCANPSQYLFWDDLHPTTAGHAAIANALAAQVPEPSALMLSAAGIGIVLLRRRLAAVAR